MTHMTSISSPEPEGGGGILSDNMNEPLYTPLPLTKRSYVSYVLPVLLLWLRPLWRHRLSLSAQVSICVAMTPSYSDCALAITGSYKRLSDISLYTLYPWTGIYHFYPIRGRVYTPLLRGSCREQRPSCSESAHMAYVP